MTIDNEIVTYQQVKDGYHIENDPFGLGAYTLDNRIKKTFLENPYLNDNSKCMAFFNRADGIICGRQIFFPTVLRVDDTFYEAQSGSSLLTAPEYRQYAVGMDMINYPIKSKEYPFIIYAGIRKMAIPIYKALRFNFIEIPEYWQPRNSRFLFQHFGLHGFVLSLITIIPNAILRILIGSIKQCIKWKTKDYKVNKLSIVPSWVDEIVKKDPHKYAEFHDSRWMQWTLDNNFFGKPEDTQSFYEIKKRGEIVGFFMTKERCSELPEHHIDKVVFGSVYEWGTIDESLLSEKTIFQLATNSFSKNTDIVSFSSNNKDVTKVLKKMFSLRHGNTTIIIKDLTKTYKDLNDINNWRLRAGYCDCPFY